MRYEDQRGDFASQNQGVNQGHTQYQLRPPPPPQMNKSNSGVPIEDVMKSPAFDTLSMQQNKMQFLQKKQGQIYKKKP